MFLDTRANIPPKKRPIPSTPHTPWLPTPDGSTLLTVTENPIHYPTRKG